MGPKFENPILDKGKLKVWGPFETNGKVLNDVVVRFLIIPEREAPIFGTATIAKSRLRHNAGITSGTFRKTVTNPYRNLKVGDKVRAIGLSVAVKDADDPHDPPAFETFTWCVTVKVV